MLLAAAVAAATTFVLGCVGGVIVRSGSAAGAGPAISIPIARGVLTLVGVAAGLVSGRFRDALVSWAAALAGLALAAQANYMIDPEWPTGDSGFWGGVLYAAVFLLPFVAGGHLFGAAIANGELRKAISRRDPLLGLLAIGCLAVVALGIAFGAAPTGDLECREASTADVASALGVGSLPAQIGEFRLSFTSACDYGPDTGRSYAAIWGIGSPRHQIQVVLSTGVPGGLPYQFSDDGGQVTFSMSEGGNSTAVYAPDLASLRTTVAAIWPGLTSRLEEEIAHPSTPQPKAAAESSPEGT